MRSLFDVSWPKFSHLGLDPGVKILTSSGVTSFWDWVSSKATKFFLKTRRP